MNPGTPLTPIALPPWRLRLMLVSPSCPSRAVGPDQRQGTAMPPPRPRDSLPPVARQGAPAPGARLRAGTGGSVLVAGAGGSAGTGSWLRGGFGISLPNASVPSRAVHAMHLGSWRDEPGQFMRYNQGSPGDTRCKNTLEIRAWWRAQSVEVRSSVMRAPSSDRRAGSVQRRRRPTPSSSRASIRKVVPARAGASTRWRFAKRRVIHELKGVWDIGDSGRDGCCLTQRACAKRMRFRTCWDVSLRPSRARTRRLNTRESRESNASLRDRAIAPLPDTVVGR